MGQGPALAEMTVFGHAPLASVQEVDSVCLSCGVSSALARRMRSSDVTSHQVALGSGQVARAQERWRWTRLDHWQMFGWSLLAAAWYASAMLCATLAVMWLAWQHWLEVARG